MRVPVLTAIAPSITDSATLSVPLREAAEKAASFVQQSVPEGTQRAYAGDWRAFTEWCALTGSSPLPADPRVVAAIEWLRRHYTFDENPGMGDSGLYYYYHTMSRALEVLGDETFVDADGDGHRWREELADALISRQREDGSWVNDNARWMENDPNLVTAYALLALPNARPASGDGR